MSVEVKKTDILIDYTRVFNEANDGIRGLTYGPEWNASHFKILSVLKTRLNSVEDTDFRVEKMYIDEFADKYIHALDKKKDIRRCYKDLKEFEKVFSTHTLRVPVGSNRPLVAKVISSIEEEVVLPTKKKAEQSEIGFYSIVVLDSFGFVPASASEDNRAYIQYSFNPKLKPFFLEIDGREHSYTQFMIDHLNRFCSKYAYKLYQELRSDLKRGFRTWPLHKLRKQLGVEDVYKGYGTFKNKVLIPALSDICEYSDIFIYYQEQKAGRKVVAIDFSIFENTTFLDRIPKEQRAHEVRPVTSGFKDADDLINTLKERFDERLEVAFEKAFKRLSKKKRAAMIETFVEGLNDYQKKQYDPETFMDSPLYSIFRIQTKEDLIKRRNVTDFEVFCQKLGYSIVKNESGEYVLKQPLLTEN